MGNTIGVTKNGKEILPELQAIKQVKSGVPLSWFTPVTDLMVIALVINAPERIREVPDEFYKNARIAKLLVFADYNLLERIPQDIRYACAQSFASHRVRLERKNREEYAALLNAQDNTFIKSVVRKDPYLGAYLTTEKKRAFYASNRQMVKQPPAARPVLPRSPELEFTYGFEDQAYSDPEMMRVNSEMFLYLPAEEKSLSDLEAILKSDELFRKDFVKRLAIPNRNAAFYERTGDMERAGYWKSQIIPWLNREICEKIACLHPEASIDTPQYLTKEGISAFFRRKAGVISPADLTRYFLMFPPELLSEDETVGINLNKDVFLHAVWLADTDTADWYLRRHPGDVLSLSQEYQTRRRILADGVVLSRENLDKVYDEDFKKCISEAFASTKNERRRQNITRKENRRNAKNA